MMNLLLDGVTILRMALIRRILWEPLIRKTHDPQRAQNKLLVRILKHNKDTTFGQEHGFTNISSYEEYREAVPVNRYEALRDYVERQDREKKPYLSPDQPVMYAQTSGTTGKPKYIPISKRVVSQYRRSQHIVAYANYAAIPGVFKGMVLAIVSPAVEGRLDTGTPYGSMSGLIYQSMPAFVRAKYVVPPKVFEIGNYDQKYYLITLHALAEKNITMIATANPSTLGKLEKIMNDQSERLLEDIQAVNLKRAGELRELLSDKGALMFSDIWPNLKSVTTWTGGSCGDLIPALKKKLPPGARIVEMGYLSSEFRGGITVEVLENRQIPALHENFFEFVEKDDWGNKTPEFLTLDQIEEGKQYYILATTQSGLYRYDINDIIAVTGRFNNTPVIRFVQKGKGVVNLTGEKLYESQLVQAVAEFKEEAGVDFDFFVMLGYPESLEYKLFVEHEPINASGLEKHLNALNMEFDSKRKSGRLKPIKVLFVRDGTGEAYKRHCLKDGQREGQFKLAHLQYHRDCSFDFTEYARQRPDAAA